MDGEHGIERCAEVSEAVNAMTFRALQELGVSLEGMLLKPNMVTKGKQCKDPTSSKEVACYTLRTLSRTVLPAMPGIFVIISEYISNFSSSSLVVKVKKKHL